MNCGVFWGCWHCSSSRAAGSLDRYESDRALSKQSANAQRRFRSERGIACSSQP